MVQILLLGFIIFLGAYLFAKYPIKKDIKLMIDSALFIVIVVLLNRLSVMIPLFGVESLQIGFEGLGLMIAGLMLPPGYAFLVGLCTDLIGLIIVPTGFPFFGFMLNSILYAVIPSLVYSKLKEFEVKNIGKICFVMCLGLLTTSLLYIFSVSEVVVSGETLFISFNQKILFMAFVVFIFIVILLTMLHMKNKEENQKLHDLYIWILIIVIVQMLVVFILTPLWLDYMYGIPFMVSFFIRVVKACIMIPLEIIVGYSVFKILRNA